MGPLSIITRPRTGAISDCYPKPSRHGYDAARPGPPAHHLPDGALGRSEGDNRLRPTQAGDFPEPASDPAYPDQQRPAPPRDSVHGPANGPAHPNPACATPVCARGHGGPRRASRRGRLRQRGVRAATNRSDGANPLGDWRRSRHDGSGWDRHAHADPRTDTRPCAGRSGSGRQPGSDGPGNRANRYDPVQLVQRRESPDVCPRDERSRRRERGIQPMATLGLQARRFERRRS